MLVQVYRNKRGCRVRSSNIVLQNRGSYIADDYQYRGLDEQENLPLRYVLMNVIHG